MDNIAAILIGALFVISAYLLIELVVSKEMLTVELNKAKANLTELEQELAEKNSELEKSVHENKLLEAELEKTREELSSCNADYEKLDSLLLERNRKIKELQAELEKTSAELQNASLQAAVAAAKISDVRAELLDLDSRISDSLSWFRENAMLPKNERASLLQNEIFRKCIAKGEAINLACVSVLFKNTLDFGYIYEENDKLQSLEAMIARYGGDCEDYSLLLKATLNSFPEDFELEAWAQGNSRYDVITTAGEILYYKNAEPVRLGKLKSLNTNAFCYITRVENGVGVQGHCANAFTQEKIEDEKALTEDNLRGTAIVEPQNGFLVGRIGESTEEMAFHVCEIGEHDCGNSLGDIIMVITDSDFFSFKEGEWEYYGKHKLTAEALAQALGNG